MSYKHLDRQALRYQKSIRGRYPDDPNLAIVTATGGTLNRFRELDGETEALVEIRGVLAPVSEKRRLAHNTNKTLEMFSSFFVDDGELPLVEVDSVVERLSDNKRFRASNIENFEQNGTRFAYRLQFEEIKR